MDDFIVGEWYEILANWLVPVLLFFRKK